ncbi:MAG TPA: ABC transporter ATP-binding protein [Thermoanaerobaculia bacterium]|nr:ABC transporter ATP-binding protein [Thermoanaerobaculia bacterium]
MATQDPHEEEVLGKAYDARLMRRLLRYLRPYRWMTLGALGLILLSSLLQLVGPLATAVAIDLFMRPAGGQTRLSTASAAVDEALRARGIDPAAVPHQGVAAVAAVYLAALALTFLTLYAEGYVMQLMGQYIMYDLRGQIFGHLQRLPVSYFDRNPIGRLVTRVTTDVDALNELFTSGLVELVGDVLLLLGIVMVLFWLDWRLALLSFSIVPLLVALTFWFRVRVRDSFREVRVKIARINAFLQEHISGMPVVQLFGREAEAARQFAVINEAHRDANVRSILYYAVFFPGVDLITAAGLGLLIWFGGGKVVAGAVSLGALIAFLQYAQRFYQPLSDLSEKYNILQGAMASSERIFRLLDTPLTIASPAGGYSPGSPAGGHSPGSLGPLGAPGMPGMPEPVAPRAMRGAIEFDHVRFSYIEDEPVLKGISFDVQPGETLAVVGHTGAGKSTLANLLLRFYDVASGAVRVDGVDVREWDLAALRRGIAMVLQDVFLFAGTIGANIRLGEPAIDEARLRWAAREVHALPFIDKLPGGMEAPVKERGAGLSVGQKQLIAFARALAFDPRILILDEATSSIDTETEQLIQKALARLLIGRTSIVIAHRLSTIQKADRILVLHKGEIRERGTHQELLAQRGIYYRLYLLQYKDQEGAAPVLEPGRGESWRS